MNKTASHRAGFGQFFGYVFFYFFSTWNTASFGQGTLRINFDGPPPQPPGTAYAVSNYIESSFYVAPSFPPGPGVSFIRRNGGGTPEVPDNGTPYVQVDAFGLSIEHILGETFGVTAVQLAAYSVNLPSYSMSFIGYVQGGGTVTNTFSGNGINFSTHNFGPEFNSIFRLIVSDYGSMDNLDLNIPEPQTGLLLLTATVLLRRFKRKG